MLRAQVAQLQAAARALSALADEEGDDGHDDENYKQDFGDAGSTGGKAAKAQYRSDQCNDEENYGVVQHDEPFSGLGVEAQRQCLARHICGR